MSVIRIQKRGREFQATRIGTLRELVRRGLLQRSDPVALDGQDFRPAGEIDELVSAFDEIARTATTSGDPWRHWSETDLDSSEWAGGEDDVLSSFLDAVAAEPTPLREPALRPRDEALPPEILTPIPESSPEREDGEGGFPSARARGTNPGAFPGALGAVREERAEAAEAGESPPAAPAPPVTVPSSPSEEPPGASAGPDAGAAEASAGSPSPEGLGLGARLNLPVSFAAWLEKGGSADDRRWLEGFGRFDEGLAPVQPLSAPSSFSLLRVGTVVLIGAVLIGSYRLYIRTGALTPFPTEAELGVPGAPDTPVPDLPKPGDAGSTTGATGPEAADPSLVFRAKALRLRNKVAGNIVPFSNSQMMEDSLFKEFQNLGVRPVQVGVEALRVRGSKDRDDQRPVQANVVVELAGIHAPDPETSVELVEERLLTTWFVLGKYATQGKVDLHEVRIEIRQPTPWAETYEGRHLAGLWTGRIPPETFFLDGQ